MINGYITTKHVFFHPLTVMSIVGFGAYLRILVCSVDSKRHCFAEFLMR